MKISMRAGEPGRMGQMDCDGLPCARDHALPVRLQRHRPSRPGLVRRRHHVRGRVVRWLCLVSLVAWAFVIHEARADAPVTFSMDCYYTASGYATLDDAIQRCERILADHGFPSPMFYSPTDVPGGCTVNIQAVAGNAQVNELPVRRSDGQVCSSPVGPAASGWGSGTLMSQALGVMAIAGFFFAGLRFGRTA